MDPRSRAAELFREAYEAQMRGTSRTPCGCYGRSLAAHPTAEAYTFLGGTYSFLGDLEEVIACCKRAIEVDASFGNPYNDIGTLPQKPNGLRRVPSLTPPTPAEHHRGRVGQGYLRPPAPWGNGRKGPLCRLLTP